MTIDIVMPQMGESIAEGTLVRWLKQVGDPVRRDEPLFEISTDKVDTEIPSPADGVLQEIKVHEGETVAIETVVALLTDANGATGAAPPAAEKPQSGPASIIDSAREVVQQSTLAEPSPPSPPVSDSKPPESVASDSAERNSARVETVSASSDSDSERRGPHRTSPLVRRIAREHDVDLEQVAGTGSGGRVTKRDILSYLEDHRPPALSVDAPASSQPTTTQRALQTAIAPVPQHGFPAEDVEVETMSPMRSKIAEHMVMSKHTSPHVTTVFEIDMTRCAEMRNTDKEEFLRVNGVKLTYLPFIMKAVISALKAYPIVNASISGKEIHYFKRVNLGIAVAVDDGLIVPVVKDADEKSIVGLSRSVRDLADRSRNRKLMPDDVKGGTFTISNHGVFGSLFATPVINQPQAAVLGVGAVTKRPVVIPESDAIAVRSMMYLALSFDHRLIDGATADRFLSHVKETLERSPYLPMD
jgi:pyruvate dehydrogenase E2 component (dihydrolipoamide acetyltransferase)